MTTIFRSTAGSPWSMAFGSTPCAASGPSGRPARSPDGWWTDGSAAGSAGGTHGAPRAKPISREQALVALAAHVEPGTICRPDRGLGML
ncbi:DUF6233 domain-containing protein [Streptomyces sp. NPDC005283]|uniref:DUF6233 domain-containing protein n=1 Tax=Streptomyces sp. NPDC005283 TaxID=3156871 RepID=UPI0034572529